MMTTTDAKSKISYTDATLELMDHPFLQDIDHYYIGTSFTKVAEEYALNNYREKVKSKVSNNIVNVNHYLMDYETFLQDPSFSIMKKMDPNTTNGFLHNLINSMTFDNDFQYKVLKELKTNPRLALPASLKDNLNI